MTGKKHKLNPGGSVAKDAANLSRLLGNFAPSRFSIVETRDVDTGQAGTRCIRMDLDRADGVRVRAFLTGPATAWSGCPAVLYCHAHGNRYEIGASELLQSRPALQPEPYGHALAEKGIVALAIDLPCFGERAHVPENSMAKRHLWQGTTLFGEMLADLAGALGILAYWPGVDQHRLGAFGISMGATLTFWLAALDKRLRCLAHLCCFADLGELIRHDGHDHHGLYMMVPGLLGHWRTGEIAGLAAPRRQFAALGARDPLTPPLAIAQALDDVRAAYAAANAPHAFQALVDAETGHEETQEMRRRVLQFFEQSL